MELFLLGSISPALQIRKSFSKMLSKRESTMSDSENTPSRDAGNSPTPPPLSRNKISYLGWLITFITACVMLVLVGAEWLAGTGEGNPYNSVVTYLLLPGVLLSGVAIILLGVALEWRRRHRHEPSEYPTLPTLDLNVPWQRRRILIGVGLVALLFSASAVGVYHSYHFTESPVFCGEVCHHVMEPEYTAYQHSPHARVSCTQCHIGPGADWYVKSKMSGLYQVYAVLTGVYELPIETPVKNLRPARETCEQCHWPSTFIDSNERTIWHFSPDQVNTPMRYNLLVHVGGGNPELGLGKGIHWHINPDVTVRYWARDEDRLDIPWVEVQEGGQPPEIYRTEDCPDPLPADAEIRVMDCIDCHNRPSHIYRSPRQLIDFHMATGALDRRLPFFKREATALLEGKYATTEEALGAIDQHLREQYDQWLETPKGRELVEANIATLKELYQRNYFPEQGVNWTVYPDHSSHFEWPGCWRCHDGEHVSESQTAVSSDCQLCHDLLDQAEGEAAFGPLNYQGGPYEHPRGLGDIWLENACTDCHGLQKQIDHVAQLEGQNQR